MGILLVTSACGGAGVTTLTANLVNAFRALNVNAKSLHFDDADSVKCHYGADRADAPEGPSALGQLVAIGAGDTLFSLVADDMTASDYVNLIAPTIDWARETGVTLIVDVPHFIDFASIDNAQFDLRLNIVRADAQSVLATPSGDDAAEHSRDAYVLNFADNRRALKRDIAFAMKEVFGERYYGAISDDAAVQEAFARRSPIQPLFPNSRAGLEIGALADLIGNSVFPATELIAGPQFATAAE